VLGVAGVGIVAMLFDESESAGGSIGLGIILIIIAQFFAGT